MWSILWNTTLGNFTFLHEVFGVDDTDRAGRYYGVNVGDYYVEINGSVCKLHNATTLLSGCSFV